MSAFSPTVKQLQCQRFSSNELITIIESMDVNAEIKVLTNGFIRFLKLNIALLTETLLCSDKPSEVFNAKALAIVTANSMEIRKVLTNDDQVTSILIEFPKKYKYTKHSRNLSRYCAILTQLILRNEFDFLGRIPNPYSFLKSLLLLSQKLSMLDFLSDLFLETKFVISHFFEQAKLASMLFNLIQTDPKNVYTYLTLVSKLTCNLLHSSPILKELTSKEFCLALINLGLETDNINAAAVAFDYVAFRYDQNYLSTEAIAAINSEMPNICKYIALRENTPFNPAMRCAVDLLMAIIRYLFEPVSSDLEEEEEDRFEESFKRPDPPFIPLNISDPSVELYKNRDPGPSFLLPPPAELPKRFIDPRDDVAKFKLSKQSAKLQVSQPKSSNAISMSSMRSQCAPFSPMREASANFNLMSLVQSCPVFSLQRPGMFVIEEEPEDQPPLIVAAPAPPEPHIRCPLAVGPIVSAAESLGRAFFAQPANTMLHNCFVELLELLDDLTVLTPRVVAGADIVNLAADARRRREELPAAFWGQLHSIESILRNSSDFTSDFNTEHDFDELFQPGWDEYEAIINEPVDLPEIDFDPDEPRPLSPD